MTKTTTILLAVATITTAFAALIPTAEAGVCAGPRTNDCAAGAPDLGEERPRKFSAWNDEATTDAGEQLNCYATGATVWFTFTAVTTGVARIVRAPEYERQPTMAVSVYSGDGELEACGAYGAGEDQEASVVCVPGETYTLQFASLNGSATGLSVFSLTGCGGTGASTSTTPTGRSGNVHENVFAGNNVVDVDASFAINTAVFDGASSFELTAVKSGATGDEQVGVVLVLGGPPNPPGVIPNPAYLARLAQWAPGAVQFELLG